MSSIPVIISADTRWHLRFTNRQLLAVPRYRLSTYSQLASQLPVPQSRILSRILCGTQPSVQAVSDVCLKRFCSLDTSAFSVLEVLGDNCDIKIYLLTLYRMQWLIW